MRGGWHNKMLGGRTAGEQPAVPRFSCVRLVHPERIAQRRQFPFPRWLAPPVLWGLLLLALSTMASIAEAQFEDSHRTSDSVQRESYLVLRSENTDLQKFLAGKRRAETDYSVHLLVDGQALLDGQGSALESMNWAQLRADLTEVFEQAVLRNLPSKTSKAIFIRSYFTTPSKNQDNLLNWTLEGFARQSAGFDLVSVSSTYSSGGAGLSERLDSLMADNPTLFDGGAEEDARENDYVKVFPVRTFFSRFLTDNADCVIVIKPKFSDEFTGGLPRAIRTSMSVLVRQLDLERRHKVVFSFAYSHPDGQEAKDWFIETGGREMQQFLEFQRSSISIGYQ